MTREEAIYRLKNTAWLGTDKDREETEQAIDMAIEALKADAVEVVRCKDCVYCEPYAIDTGEDCMTGLWCGKNQKDITLQDFCSYGERKGVDAE